MTKHFQYWWIQIIFTVRIVSFTPSDVNWNKWQKPMTNVTNANICTFFWQTYASLCTFDCWYFSDINCPICEKLTFLCFIDWLIDFVLLSELEQSKIFFLRLKLTIVKISSSSSKVWHYTVSKKALSKCANAAPLSRYHYEQIGTYLATAINHF